MGRTQCDNFSKLYTATNVYVLGFFHLQHQQQLNKLPLTQNPFELNWFE